MQRCPPRLQRPWRWKVRITNLGWWNCTHQKTLVKCVQNNTFIHTCTYRNIYIIHTYICMYRINYTQYIHTSMKRSLAISCITVIINIMWISSNNEVHGSCCPWKAVKFNHLLTPMIKHSNDIIPKLETLANFIMQKSEWKILMYMYLKSDIPNRIFCTCTCASISLHPCDYADNGFLPENIKVLSQTMLTYHHWLVMYIGIYLQAWY